MFQLSDATANAQRIAVDNSINTEFGPATPSAPLSFAGRRAMNGSVLDQSLARSQAMPRQTGAVSVGAGATAYVAISGLAGFGSIDGDGGIVSFDSGGFTVYSTAGTTTSLNYGVF